MASDTCAQSRSVITKTRPFRWSHEMIELLINNIETYKTMCEYEGKDFDADRTKQYEWIRVQMLEMYSDHFGPAEADIPHAMEMSKDEKEAYVKDLKVQRDFIKKGYCRIQEKVKEIRQNFGTAVTNGKRSGSGKIVFEFYDRLAKIYGGSASASPLSIGVDTDTFSTINQEQCDEIGLTITDESHDGSDLSSNDSLDTSSGGVSLGDKRGAEDACVKLIDNKRKHMERTPAQRDQFSLKKANMK
ncbi:uncharacterized protein LOC124441607 [Xenia sp. Carnegie-2017]|uniref:uncharacterized protein LOC124441607 n=1 Tax=Xenia sp. Carnegie-2017 TaxID=2897299 RepID=UPI001F045C5B|nr:uncharacterized protein LOC124441607 [Xenia sp. Carnegie-2017]